ncbi:MAG: hypothetical protein GXP62_12095 [Oligoflexia bacterium]|nr:hypothetical protein [Oligoflexia bacterium]
MTRSLFTLAALLLSPTAFAVDAVTQVSVGTPIRGDGMRVAVWTSTSATTPARVELAITAQGDAPAVPGNIAVLSRSVAQQQLWEVQGLPASDTERGSLASARVTLMDAKGDVLGLGPVELSLTPDALTCSEDEYFSSFGSVHGHLKTAADGHTMTLSLVVQGATTPSVAAIRVAFATAKDTQQDATLARVQELWTADLAVPGAAGHRYQIDGTVVDPSGQPYGTSFVADVTVSSRPPTVAAPCPVGSEPSMRVASR